MARILSLLLLAAALGLHCANLAGPGGEGNGSETIARGVITDSAGLPAAGVPVQMLPADYNPVASDTVSALWRAFTDSRGGYSFAGVPAGSFTLEASSITTGMKAFVKDIEFTGKKVEALLDTGKLVKTGTVFVPLAAGGFSEGDYIYLPGTSTFAIITKRELSAGQAILANVPAGSFSRLIHAEPAGSGLAELLADPLTVAPGDTVVSAYAGWKYSRKVLLNTSSSGAGITGNVVNFPVLVRLNSANFKFNEAQGSGADIRFTRPDGLPLSHEIERWDATGQRAELWVRVDTVFGASSAQFISMYWGNEGAGGSAAGAAVFDTANAFIGVWHLNEPPIAGTRTIRDRTVNGHHAASFGAMSSSNSVDGLAGMALSFNGVNDYLAAGNVSIPGTYTIGLWVRVDTAGKPQRFIYKDSSYTLWYSYSTDTADRSIRVEHMSAREWWRGLLQDGGTRTPLTANVWLYLTGSFDGSVVRLFVNGTEVSRSNVISSSPVNPASDLWFGKCKGDIDFVKGAMDEIRVEGIARSADWIRLCYMNQRADDRLVVLR